MAWSPDGTRILVSVNDRQPAFIVGLDSPHRREVGILRNPEGRFHGVRAAAWSPDGSQIALVGPSLVAIVPADGGPIRGLAESVGITVNVEGQPTRDLVVLSGSDFDWQPLNAKRAGHARRRHGLWRGRGGGGPGRQCRVGNGLRRAAGGPAGPGRRGRAELERRPPDDVSGTA